MTSKINVETSLTAPRSLHDNILLSYRVDAYNKRISLSTIHLLASPREHEYTTVAFGGVLTYHFAGDTLGTIIFDLKEVPIEQIYDAYESLFVSQKKDFWPPLAYDTTEVLFSHLRERDIKGFLLTASQGMTGFVLAERMSLFATNILPITEYLPTAFVLYWFDKTTDRLVADYELDGVGETDVRLWLNLAPTDEARDPHLVPPETARQIAARFNLPVHEGCDCHIELNMLNDYQRLERPPS